MSEFTLSLIIAVIVLLPYAIQRLLEAQEQSEFCELAHRREIRHTQMGRETYDPYR